MELNYINFKYKVNKDITGYFALFSDLHIGNREFDKGLFTEQFEEAKRLNAKIFLNGDIMDLILPKDQKRYSASNDKYKTDSHINKTIEETLELLEPYAEYIEIIGLGNHEVSTLKYHAIDPVSIIIFELNKKKKGIIQHGGYTGFIVLRYEHYAGGAIRTYTIFYNHGQGGSSEITKGTIDLSRRNNIDANLIWLGHKHSRVIMELDSYIGVSKNIITERSRIGVITGSYLKNIKQYNIKKEGYIPDYSEERMRTRQARRGGIILKINIGSNNIIKDSIIC